MKKILPFLLIVTVITTYVACMPKHATKTENAGFAIEYEPDDGPLSEQDFYLDTAEWSGSTLRTLVDICNAHAVLHNAWSDFECWVRFNTFSPATIMAARPEVIADPKLRSAVRRYLQQLSALIDTTAAPARRYGTLFQAISVYDALDSLIAENYNVDRFVWLDEETYWEQYDKRRIDKNYDQIEQQFASNDNQLIMRLEHDFAHARNIDRKCVIALELAHVTDLTDDDGVSVAAPLLLQCLQAGQYSIYLMEVWCTWRTLVQQAHGASKDSDLLNQCFNKAKVSCLHTILREVVRTGGDRFAVNELLVMSSVRNVCRYGVFLYGNQNVVDYCNIFPERFPDGDDEAAEYAAPMLKHLDEI